MIVDWIRARWVLAAAVMTVALLVSPAMAQGGGSGGATTPPGGECQSTDLNLVLLNVTSTSAHLELRNDGSSAVDAGFRITTQIGTKIDVWGAVWYGVAPGQTILADITSPVPFAVVSLEICTFTEPVGDAPDPFGFGSDPPPDEGGEGEDP